MSYTATDDRSGRVDAAVHGERHAASQHEAERAVDGIRVPRLPRRRSVRAQETTMTQEEQRIV